MVFRQNTVARHTRYVFDLLLDPGSGSMLIDANVIAEGFVGVGNDAVRPGVQYTCDLPWDNVQNWPFDSDLTGIDGNISVSPWFCDSANDNFHVAGNSPCLPAHNSCGVQLGAFGLGCGPISVEPETWAGIKSRYRSAP